jgi:hypothetical protein
MAASMASIAATPIMAPRPLISSAAGVRGPSASALVLAKAGMSDAAMKRANVMATAVGWLESCSMTLLPVQGGNGGDFRAS